MLYSEIIAVCSQFHTKHINTLCGQNVELLNVKLAVHIVTTGLYLKVLSSSFMSVQKSPSMDPNPEPDECTPQQHTFFLHNPF